MERLAAVACVIHAKESSRSKILLNDRYTRGTRQDPKSIDLVATVRDRKVPLKLRKEKGCFVATTEDGKEIK